MLLSLSYSHLAPGRTENWIDLKGWEWGVRKIYHYQALVPSSWNLEREVFFPLPSTSSNPSHPRRSSSRPTSLHNTPLPPYSYHHFYPHHALWHVSADALHHKDLHVLP